MDGWGWQQLEPWLERRVQLPIGALLCVLHGPTAGRPWSAAAARAPLHQLAVTAGVRRRFTPQQLRHATPSSWPAKASRSTSSNTQLGHPNLGVTSVSLQGVDNIEIIDIVHARPAPMLPASAGPMLSVVARSDSSRAALDRML